MEKEEVPLAGRLSAAAGAAVISALVTNPLDVVKTRLQAQLNDSTGTTNSRCPHQSRLPGYGTHLTGPSQNVYRGGRQTSFDLMRTIWTREGPLAFYRGLKPNVLAAAPTVGIYLPLYDTLQDKLKPSCGSLAPLSAGSVSRTVAVLLVAPLELLRTRIMAAPATRHLACTVPAESFPVFFGHLPPEPMWPKVLSLWRGVGATLLRDVPFTAIFWTLTEPIRESIISHTSPEAASTSSTLLGANMLAASVSGIIAAAATTPFDVIKTQQQLAKGSPSIWATGAALYQQQGWTSFFTGVWPRCVRAVPSCAIVISSYELLKRHIALNPIVSSQAQEDKDGIAGT